MIASPLKAKLQKYRPMRTITFRILQDAVASLTNIAPHKGLSGYQALLKSYVSECLRRDEAVYRFDANARFAEALKKRGVSPELIEAALESSRTEHASREAAA